MLSFSFFLSKKITFLLLAMTSILESSGAAEISKLGLWGNYSIPKDNPFSEDKDLQPEIWALGLRNPWRCSFDAERPSYFVCADVGEVCEYLSIDKLMISIYAAMLNN